MDWYKIIESVIQIGITGVAALIVTWFYSKKQSDLSHDEFQRDLFRELNHRYDALNDNLHDIYELQKKSESSLSLKKLSIKSPELLKCLNDYLNLCAEEYFWYKKGRVDDAVWKSWNIGMNWWYSKLQPLQELWDEEKENGNFESYYLEAGEDLFDSSTKVSVR